MKELALLLKKGHLRCLRMLNAGLSLECQREIVEALETAGCRSSLIWFEGTSKSKEKDWRQRETRRTHVLCLPFSFLCRSALFPVSFRSEDVISTLSVSLSLYVCLSLYVSLSLSLSVSLSLCLSASLSLSVSLCLSISLSVCPSLSVGCCSLSLPLCILGVCSVALSSRLFVSLSVSLLSLHR